jgi:D-alanyl-lipoteichoic acid acyltransferase DltB (MBOAT superfamily)
MTLSRFLRDFLYIPLGGNRGSRWFIYRNLMITMILGGLWHGAAWTYVIWGGLHGVGLVLDHVIGGRWKTPVWLRWFVTYNLITLLFILFRAESLGVAWSVLKRFGSWGAPTNFTLPVLLCIGVAIIPQLMPASPWMRLQDWAGRLNPAILAVALGVLILFVAATVPSDGVPPFIYFRF